MDPDPLPEPERRATRGRFLGRMAALLWPLAAVERDRAPSCAAGPQVQSSVALT